MRLILPEISCPIDVKLDSVTTIYIENPKVLYSVLSAFFHQVNKSNEKIVLSQDNKLVEVSKHVEFINQYIPMDINRKTLLNRVQNRLVEIAKCEMAVETTTMIAELNKYLYRLIDFDECNIDIKELDVADILKISGIQFTSDFNSLAEELFEYIKNIVLLEGEKLFVICRLSDYLFEEEWISFQETLVKHKIRTLFIEANKKYISPYEKSIAIDKDLCVI